MMRHDRRLLNVSRWAACLLLPLALTSCGGGSGGSAGGSPPPPTQTFTYIPATDFTADRNYTTAIGYKTTAFTPAGSPLASGARALPLDQPTITLAYSQASDSVTFRYRGQAAGDDEAVSFSGAERDLNSSFRRYVRGIDDLIVYQETGTATTYVNEVGWRTRDPNSMSGGVPGTTETIRRALFGAATDPRDSLPMTANYTGSVLVGGNSTINSREAATISTGGLQIAGDGKTMTGSANTATGGFTNQQQALRFNGTLDRAPGKFSGAVTDEYDPSVSGTFYGQLFGPMAREIGFVLRYTRTSDAAVFGGEFTGVR